MTTFLFPVHGLTVEVTVAVGPVRLLPNREARELLALRTAELVSSPALSASLVQFADELTDAVAQVDADDQETAARVVEDALAVFRAWSYSISVAALPSFGLRDGAWSGQLKFVDMNVGGSGWMHYGHHIGLRVSADYADLFGQSLFATLAAAAVATEKPSEAQRRALLASRVASQALLSRDPGVQTVLAMTAAEALLIERRNPELRVGPKTWTLAQRAVFLLCGAPEAEYCGRDRETCPVLALDPNGNSAGKNLGRLRDLGNSDVRWRCSEWHHVLDWYDQRSGVVHQADPVDKRNTSQLMFWVIHNLLPACLLWFKDHSDDPIGDLVKAINDLPSAPDWKARIDGSSAQFTATSGWSGLAQPKDPPVGEHG